MTFIIVGGVVEFDFSRLLKITDELCEEGVLDSKTTKAQIGHCYYKPKNYDSYRFVNGELFQKDINDADIIITHGGVGTLVRALKLGKKVIVFPRLNAFQEHLDDHQIDISMNYSQNGHCLVATNKDELKACLMNIDNFCPEPLVLDNSKMTDVITNYLDSL